MNFDGRIPGVADGVSIAAQHISDDTLDELLIDPAALGEVRFAAAQSHLHACATCRERQMSLQATLSSFRESTLAWSEARSNTLNRDLSGALAAQSARGRIFGVPVGVAGPVLASLLVAGAALLHLDPRAAFPDRQAASAPAALVANVAVPPAPGTQEGEAAPAEQLVSARSVTRTGGSERTSDDAMLQAIDTAIYAPEPSPAELYRPAAEPANATNRIEE